MRQLAVVSILILISLVAHAREPFKSKKPVLCADPKTVIEGLTQDSNEQPFWTGISSDNNKYILFTNTKTRTWSLVEYNDKIACVLGVGEKSVQIFLGPGV